MAPAGAALKTLQKLFISDALQSIKAGQAQSFEGELAGTACRVLKQSPFENLGFGYVYTQNSNQSKHPLKEVLSLDASEGFEVIGTPENDETWDAETKQLNLHLEPGTSDLLVFVHTAPKVKLNLSSKLETRPLSKQELRAKTKEAGSSRQIQGTDCVMRIFKTPYSCGVLLQNGPADAAAVPRMTLQLQLILKKRNYRIEGEQDDLQEAQCVLQPGQEYFLMLEKIDPSEPASVKISTRHSLSEGP